ncbi:MAG: HD domain-containing protein [Promethearchaeota archaeon]
MIDINKYWKALTYMAEHHGDQKRKSGKMVYIIHPIRIAFILRSVGFTEANDEDLLIAALFHDLIEDTNIEKKRN